MRHGTYVCAVLVCAVLPSVAFASFSLITDDRGIAADLELTDIYGTTYFGPMTDEPAFGADFNSLVSCSGSVGAGAASGETWADQVSAILSTPVSTTITAQGTADVFAQTDLDAISAWGEAESEFKIEFALSEPFDYLLSGSLSEQNASSQLRLRNVTLGTDVYYQTTEGPVAGAGTAGTLEPGTYELTAKAFAAGLIYDLAVLNKAASYDNIELGLTPVPEPGTLGLLAGGLLVAARRRRS